MEIINIFGTLLEQNLFSTFQQNLLFLTALFVGVSTFHFRVSYRKSEGEINFEFDIGWGGECM